MPKLNRSDYFSEINTVMNFFGMVDNCQNVKHSIMFSLDAMPIIEKTIKKELRNPEAVQLFEDLEQIFFPYRTTKGEKCSQ